MADAAAYRIWPPVALGVPLLAGLGITAVIARKGAPAPLQAAGAVGMAFDADYYNHLALEYRERRDVLCSALAEAGFSFSVPEGAYYVLADYTAMSESDDRTFAHWLASEVGIATVPGSGFYHDRSVTPHVVRFAFCKKRETLEQAVERLAAVRARV